MRFFLLIFFTVIINYSKAQEVPGYIIIHENDTIRGIVHIRGAGMLYQKVNFIYLGKIYKMRPGEILGYGFTKNSKSYNFEATFANWSKLLLQKKRILFLQVLERGVISLYKYDDDLDEVIDINSFFYKDGKIEYLKLDEIKFLQQMRELFKDDGLLLEELGRPGYKQEDLIKMIHEYNIHKASIRI